MREKASTRIVVYHNACHYE